MTWIPVTGSEGNRSYSLGWFHALTSFLPHPHYKLMRYMHHPLNCELVEDSPAQSAPTPQCTNSFKKR